MRRTRTIATALLALTTGGCGGGSGGDTTAAVPPPAPTPTPTPAPTPTPTPTPTTNSTLSDLRFDQVFPTVSAYLYAFGTSGVVSRIEQTEPVLGDYLSYAAATRSYTNFGQPPAPRERAYTREQRTWGPGEIVAQQTTARFTIYSKGFVDDTSTQLDLFNAGTGNDLLALRYAGFGAVRLVRSFFTQDREYRPFSYGLRTGMPISRSGTATYTGVMIAHGVEANTEAPGGPNGDGEFFDLTGSITLSVDFTARTISGRLVFDRADGLLGTSVALGAVALTQGSTTSLDTLSGSVGNGRFLGFFAGPAAEELSLTFTFDAADPRAPSRTIRIAGSGAAKL